MSTAIVQVSSHGSMCLTDDKTFNTFHIPDGFTLVKVSVITPGVCNFTTNDEINEAHEIIKRNFEFIDSLFEEIDQRGTLDSNDKNIQKFFDFFREMDESNVNSLKRNEKCPLKRDYYYHDDKKYVLTVYNDANPEVLNKNYSRSNSEYFENSVKDNYDYKINWVNKNGEPDLLSEINNFRPTRTDASNFTSLEEIVIYFNSQNIKKVFLIDFSCANIYDSEYDDISKRTERQLRRDILKRKIYGGKKRKTKKRRRRSFKKSKAKRNKK